MSPLGRRVSCPLLSQAGLFAVLKAPPLPSPLLPAPPPAPRAGAHCTGAQTGLEEALEGRGFIPGPPASWLSARTPGAPSE